MTKISALTPLGDGLAVGDQFIIRDIDDAGTPNKSVTISGMTRGLEVGTALAPSIAFAADKNTGIYGTGSDVLALVTAGENRLHITAGGLVGIGASSPGELLHLRKASSFAIELDDTTNAHYIAAIVTANNYGNGSTAGQLYLRGASGIGFTGNGGSSTGMVLDSSNRLGIGTQSPLSRLHVEDSGEPIIYIRRDTTSATSLGGPIWRNNSFNVASIITQNINSNSADLTFSTSSGGSLSERARIDSSGRMLVGTSSTSGENCTLQVRNNSALAAEFFTSSDDTAGPYIHLTKSRGTAASPTEVSSGDTLGAIAFFGYDGSTYRTAARIVAEADGTWTDGGDTTDNPGRLVFSTTADGAASPTERMRIKSNGFTEFANDGTIAGGSYHVIRSSLNEDSCYVRNSNASFSNHILRVAAARDTSNSSYYFINCVREGVLNVFFVADSGNVTNTNNSYTGISDIKLKENIVDANSQWDDIKALRVRNYNLKKGQTHKQIGLVAQEVETISPGLVYETPDRDEEGNGIGTTTKVVQYSVLYMKAVKALQEAMERIETLETSNADMLARVTALEAA